MLFDEAVVVVERGGVVDINDARGAEADRHVEDPLNATVADRRAHQRVLRQRFMGQGRAGAHVKDRNVRRAAQGHLVCFKVPMGSRVSEYVSVTRE